MAQLPPRPIEDLQQLVNVVNKTNFDLVLLGLRAVNVIDAKWRSAIWLATHQFLWGLD
ncbi:hypothetical protein AAC691_12620 [Nguyenibacter vanlangensis]|uniref:Uncharacterized protein n=1 Tax=Nguyenibacter vanlangensis TaxID=1216886 RepID=A0ABZ3D096_9PROT